MAASVALRCIYGIPNVVKCNENEGTGDSMDNNEMLQKAQKAVNDILNLARNTLLVKLRFLDAALHEVKPKQSDEWKLAVDGEYLYYDLRSLIETFKAGKEQITRCYLHCVLHCVFRHMFVSPSVNRPLWDLACDIAIENMINELSMDCVTTPKAQAGASYIGTLESEVKPMTAEKLYRHFCDLNLNELQAAQMREDYFIDDHEIWYVEKGADGDGNGEGEGDGEGDGEGEGQLASSWVDSGSDTPYTILTRKQLEERWKRIAERMQVDMESFSKHIGIFAGGLMQELKSVNREKYDYADFLKKFATLGEVMKVNTDEFDYVFYTYGLELYENMPLVEPLEYKDEKRIREFVIAIDTSASTSGDLVQRFLNKTYNILMQQENFFTKINLHILQCDTVIQEDVKITCQEDFDEYMKDMKIYGGGGTDFRPVFGYVNKLIADKEFQNLKGIIYFTDGCGHFPKSQPAYDAAFVFIDHSYNNYDVPVWAIKLVLQPEDI